MSVIRIKNKYNLTTENVKGKPVEYRQDNYEPIPIGFITHADEEYLYIDYNGDEDLLIEFSDDVSMELGGDDSVQMLC